MSTLRLEGVVRTYHQGTENLPILRGVDLTIAPGELVALVAPSGTGKSTLLHIAGLLEKPSEGDVIISDRRCAGLSDGELTRIRRDDIGFVYQFHHLLPELTASENVMMPQLIAGLPKIEARKRATEILSFLGLAKRLDHQPGKLSGGEQQRVAIARAVANAPRLLLADEPTGNLDPQTADHVFGLLSGIVKQSGLAALVATHNIDLALKMDRRITLKDGKAAELA